MLIWVAHEKKAHTFANLYQLYVANILISDVNTWVAKHQEKWKY